VRFDGVAAGDTKSLPNYLTSGWVAGLQPETVRETTVNGLPAATARASAERWDFDVTVIRVNNQIFRFLTAVPKGSTALDPTAQLLRDSFRRMTPEEITALKPLRVRVVTVGAGDTLASLANRMMGTDRKLDLFKLINAMPAGANVALGDKVKLISE
jgi:predicted Zn-dependent protease